MTNRAKTVPPKQNRKSPIKRIPKGQGPGVGKTPKMKRKAY